MKKIIAVMAALMFAAVLLNINALAISNDMTAEQYEAYLEYKSQFERDYLNLLGAYENGYITYDEFQQRADEITERYNEVNLDDNGTLNSIAQNTVNTVNGITQGIGNAVSNVGDSVKDWISEVIGGHETTESVPTTDLKGYSCLKIEEDSSSAGAVMRICTYFNGYIEVSDKSDGYKFYNTYFDDGTCYVMRYKNGIFLEKNLLTNRPNSSTASSATRTIWVYGDVRNTDGTPAETDDTYVDQPTYDFSEATDNELDELLQELSEELKRQNPDLSTMEGLLESIYYRLGKLDSDDDNSLLGQIVSSINSLKESIENIDFEFDTDKEYNFEDIFGDFEFSIDFSDFFVDLEANINLYFTVEDGYFDTKFTELKDNFNSEFAFIDNISSYVKKIFDAFDALWEEDSTTEPEEGENDTAEYNS